MKIAILNYKDAVPTCVTGPADIWSGMSRMYPVLTGQPLKVDVSIDLVCESQSRIVRSPYGAKEKIPVSGKHLYDLVIIPAMRFDKIDSVLKKEQGLKKWLRDQHKRGANLASICVGAFLFADTGLLNGKNVTTNWLFAEKFRSRFPETKMEDEKVIVDQAGLYSCGGAFSFTSFMIYLISRFCGRHEALIAAKMLMINVHEEPQNSFSLFQFQHGHGDEAIAKTQRYIESNYKAPLNLNTLAALSNMSVRNFIRRFQVATTNTPLQYLQRVRIEAAKKLLESRNMGVEQVAAMCGYESDEFFRKIFKRHVSITPSRYQQKFFRFKPA